MDINSPMEQEQVSGASNEIEPTWRIALTIWWAWLWRGLLAGMLSGFVVGLVMGMIEMAVNSSSHVSTGEQLVNFALGAILGFFWSVYFMKYILKKSFGSFRIAILKK